MSREESHTSLTQKIKTPKTYVPRPPKPKILDYPMPSLGALGFGLFAHSGKPDEVSGV